jgi:hypothetical protein
LEIRNAVSALLRQSPAWLNPHRALLQTVLDRLDSCVADALNATRGNSHECPQFVAQSALPAGDAYETFIARTHCVPTRDNLHDLFNGLVWLGFPRTKRRLNELQAAQIATHGIAGTRGAVRDALTLFDENAAILIAPGEVAQRLRQRDWRELFVVHRAQWSSVQLIIFGHALLEKLLQPRKSITAHVWLVDEPDDAALAASLTVSRLRARPFMALPVLGVPGWWSANEDPAFYEDAAVFRPQPSAAIANRGDR